MSAAARWSILIGGGAGGAAGPKKSGAAAAKNVFSKIPEKNSFYPQNFLMAFLWFLVIENRKLQQNKYTEKMASAARRQIIGGGASIKKVGGGCAHKLSAA